jgi:hypothetical protein
MVVVETVRAGSTHPTVKPVKLMQWLVRFVTPPGGTVLDPFAGSGATGTAADLEGRHAILIERESQYVRDIEGLSDFQCGRCEKWWSIGDAPSDRSEWCCPWYGLLDEFDAICPERHCMLFVGLGDVRVPMVSNAEVVAAYRLILGREPEDDEVVASHARQADTLADLRERFFSSPEFVQPFTARLSGGTLDSPAMEIELDASPEQLIAMRNQIEENWRRLGIDDPHWSVLSHDNYRAANIEQTKAAFFDSGRDFLKQCVTTFQRCGLDVKSLLFPPRGDDLFRVRVWGRPLHGLAGRGVWQDNRSGHFQQSSSVGS